MHVDPALRMQTDSCHYQVQPHAPGFDRPTSTDRPAFAADKGNTFMHHRFSITLGCWLLTGGSVAAGCPAGHVSTQRGDAAAARACLRPAPAHASPRIEWLDRWGAIATGAGDAFGIAEDRSNQHDAETVALAQCRDRAGGACAIVQSYSNQCAALALGAAGAGSTSAASSDDAERIAIDRCGNKAAAPADCRLAYSGCSHPARSER